MELVINFFVNTEQAKKIVKGFKDYMDNNAGAIKKSFISKLGNIGGLILGGFSIREVYQQTKALSNLSDKFDLGVEKISRFNNMLSLFGGNTQDTVKIVDTLQQAIVDYRTEGTGALRDLQNLVGLNIFKENGDIKNSLDLIKELRKEFKQNNQDAAVIEKTLQKIGLNDTPALMRYIKASDKEFNEMTAKSEKFSVVNEKTKQTVIRINRTLAGIKQSLYSVGSILLENLEFPLKIIEKLFESFNNLGEKTKKTLIAIGMILTTFGSLKAIFAPLKYIGSITKLVSLKPLLGMFNGLKTVLLSIKYLIMGIIKLAIANPYVAAIVAIIGALVLLYKKSEKFRNIVDNLFMKIKNFFSGLLENIKMVCDFIKDKLSAIGKLWDKITFKKKKAEVEIKKEEEDDKAIGDYNPNILKSFALKIPPKNYSNSSSSINNSNNTTSNNFTINLNTVGNVKETESMLSRLVKQNTGTVR